MTFLDSCKGSSYGEKGNNEGRGIRVVISFGGRRGTFPRVCVAGGLGDDGSIFGGSRNNGGSGSGGGGASSSLSALTGACPVACRGLTAATTHHFAEPAHDLIRGVLPGIEPREVVLMQLTALVDRWDVKHLAVARA